MKEQHKHIEELVERFLDGVTTNTEEKELSLFFFGDDIPEHLSPYKPMFAWFTDELRKEFNQSSAKTAPVQPRHRFRVWATVAAVAAAVALLLFIRTPGESEFAPYEGSYIVRNGEVITDPAEVLPVIRATLQAVGQQEQEIEQMLSLAQSAIMTDHNLEVQIQDILNGLPESETRKEMFHLLYSTK